MDGCCASRKTGTCNQTPVCVQNARVHIGIHDAKVPRRGGNRLFEGFNKYLYYGHFVQAALCIKKIANVDHRSCHNRGWFSYCKINPQDLAKGSNLAEDASSSVIDILKSQTANRLAQRSAQQQFEKIGDRVGENLLPLFEAESRQLDEGSRTAVALAVAETFNTSKITSDLLAKHNLEPTELAKHIQGFRPLAPLHF